MNEELQALNQNNTWTLVPRPKNANIIGSKWVYRIKYTDTGAIERFKARLVAKGFTQVPGIDYEETFSPVIKHTTIRLVLALAVNLNWSMKQLDVRNAFLHGHLNETVYIEQPPGFINPKLPSHADTSLFILHFESNIVLLLVYVDDVIITGNNSKIIQHIIHTLSSQFALKDLGSLNYFLGIEIKKFKQGIFLSQAKYARDLLDKTKMQDSTAVATPMAVKEVPRFDDAQPVNATEYRQIVGSLQYLTFTRPDITHAVNKVCQKFQQPTKADLRAVKRILRYLKGTLNFGLRYLKQSSLTLYGFLDSDWAGCPLTRRSTSGFCIYLGSNCISWSSKKQTTVARSSAEAEYRCMASTAVKLTWLMYIFKEIGINLIKPPVLICDNISALHMSKNLVFHARTKHIELDYHFVREKVTSGLLNTRYIPPSQQTADLFTKPLSKALFSKFRHKLGIHPVAIPSLKGADNNQFQINNNQDNDNKAIMNSTKGRNKFSS
ncbi:reverse transcriptase Ty1/copia-type domain-containing protein [Citrus sinensis]|uniref:Reverse transcriptase Ty1/copia-type domain-containing protein n=1 Tax=Citrus sinensis TaxID=2711 RepID=A0ACB8JMF8_CITSI|nr:reverse transcriptase Ty1/copia-type domain-containing protein [Citrus sinensis]